MNGIGARIREIRIAQHKSLNDVSARMNVSAATLSRIETDKQGLTIDLFLLLTKILQVRPAEILGDGEEDHENHSIADRVAAMRPSERIRLWSDLTESRNTPDRSDDDLAADLEELIAQVGYLRQAIEQIRQRTGERRRRSRRSPLFA